MKTFTEVNFRNLWGPLVFAIGNNNNSNNNHYSKQCDVAGGAGDDGGV